MELYSCSACGVETPWYKGDPESAGYKNPGTELDIWKHADQIPFYDPRTAVENHGLILGSYGSGKTTLQYWMIGFFFSNAFNHRDGHGRYKICRSQYGKGFLVILRAARHTFEYLSLCEVAPVRLFIPNKCVYQYEHPNLSIVNFDLDDSNQVFQKLERDKINVIGVNHFLDEPDARYEWWGRFVLDLMNWKGLPENIDKRTLFCFDEISDIVPQKGEARTKSHGWWGNRIREEFDSFRRNNIKIVATTFSITDIKKNFRNNFHHWFIKRTTAESVPERYRNFGPYIIEKMTPDQVFVKDAKADYDRKFSPAWVLPGKIGVYTETAEEIISRADSWRKRYFELLDFCLDAKKVARKDLMLLHNMKRPAVDMMIFRHREEKHMGEALVEKETEAETGNEEKHGAENAD